ncbi:uncharacterized protein LOC119829143 [Zerene cesonia]|uniref:uncharacterized protein LOC119829143 n=1 Tax=Zerene cesonia TaxID=33412 RepID=UPI0018E4F313|nr:uncharacterized protein LOC119829143 [Zerene cesonia]
MRRKLFVLLVLLLASNNIAYGKNGNKTKTENSNKNRNKLSNKAIDRFKRSSNNHPFSHLPNDDDITSYNKLKLMNGMINSDRIEEDIPFWGSRGRRESSSTEHLQERFKPKENYYPDCNGMCFPFNSDERNEVPFWGNRGRRDFNSQSGESSLWDERFRRQDDDDDNPFWGSRGRRDEDIPFWGSRGRRENSLDSKQYLSSSKSPDVEDDDDEEMPFWGNRGRRRMNKEKGHSQDVPEPFWGSRGKKGKNKFQKTDEEQIPFWGNRGRRKNELGGYVMKGYDYDDLDSMSKMKRKELSSSFWANRGRQSRLNNLFSGVIRSRMQNLPTTNDLNKEVSKGFHIKPSEQNTVHDDRIYAEEPHYILIERSSRASVEDDPYIITRGKKYSNFHIPKAVRDRRGAIDDIFKSVQNDPYYIARGKKDSFVKLGNTIMSMESLNRDREALCTLINSLLSKAEGHKIKREVDDSERERRTILKKLAAQLQQDPYFVSRGKKDAIDNEKKIKGFVEQVIEMCY